MTNTENAILKTISWFDLFDYPLTKQELKKYLINSSDSLSLVKGLKSLIKTQDDFYFLKHRQDLIKIRNQRYNIAQKKIRKARKIARFLRFIPWIRMITVCNTLGYFNAPKNSDIDLFIITLKNRIWITRFFTVGFLKMFRLRPRLARFGSRREIKKDKIDANFFISEDSLDFENLKLEGFDIYLTYWIIQQIPLYDIDNYYQKFIKANAWIKKFIQHLPSLPIGAACKPCSEGSGFINFEDLQLNNDYKLKPVFGWFRKIIIKLTCDIDEKSYKWLQLKILPAKIKNIANKNTNVVITDSILKFHDQDRREYYRNIWLEKLKNLL